MTMSDKNETLEYKLKGNFDTENIEAWGHEYIRHLSGEIVSVWGEMDDEEGGAEEEEQREEKKEEEEAAAAAAAAAEQKAEADKKKRKQLVDMVKSIVPSQMKHHAEAEACDLLMEVERLDLLDE